MPRIAISNLSPAFACSVSTTRLGMLKPWIVAGLGRPRAARHRAVHPGFGIIVDRERQHRDGAARIEIPDLRRNRQVRAVPCHEQPPAADAIRERLGLDRRATWNRRSPSRPHAAGCRRTMSISDRRPRAAALRRSSTSMFFHCAPNALTPSSVIRFTTWAAGICGGMIGIGLAGGAGGAAGAWAPRSAGIRSGNPANATHATQRPMLIMRMFPSVVCSSSRLRQACPQFHSPAKLRRSATPASGAILPGKTQEGDTI